MLASSYSVECGTREHMSIVVLAVLGLIFYTAGYLVFTSLVLFKLYAKKKFSDTRSLHRYGFIYERFELGYAWTAVMSTYLTAASLLLATLFCQSYSSGILWAPCNLS